MIVLCPLSRAEAVNIKAGGGPGWLFVRNVRGDRRWEVLPRDSSRHLCQSARHHQHPPALPSGPPVLIFSDQQDDICWLLPGPAPHPSDPPRICDQDVLQLHSVNIPASQWPARLNVGLSSSTYGYFVSCVNRLLPVGIVLFRYVYVCQVSRTSLTTNNWPEDRLRRLLTSRIS